MLWESTLEFTSIGFVVRINPDTLYLLTSWNIMIS